MPIGSSTRRSRALTGAACLSAVLTAALTGCGTSAEQAAPPPAQVPAAPPAGRPAAQPERADRQELNAQASAAQREAAAQRRVQTARRWGLAAVPLRAPAAPSSRPELAEGPGVKRTAGLPPVVYRVPTQDKVVFLTVDDGAEKDPEFSRMLAELEVPVSAFLSDYLARSDYEYFRRLERQGVAIQNHTVNHPDLRRLDDTRQQQEICGQQDRLEREIGTRPRLFRPPYGEYTATSLRIAAGCGITAVPLWNEEAFADHLEYRYADQRLHPGDIVLTHFRGPDSWKGTMTDMLRRFLDAATAQGFAVARLEDYL
ncbi:polysaccharide deacetylase family protein [Kitasatospora sp. NPDC048365]|uniref:polysaccharide deacetylase family protein n=1 Tax=Kitasatospora sp. NPDC048365 TaxID=3364050 RepID=UPI0037136640